MVGDQLVVSLSSQPYSFCSTNCFHYRKLHLKPGLPLQSSKIHFPTPWSMEWVWACETGSEEAFLASLNVTFIIHCSFFTFHPLQNSRLLLLLMHSMQWQDVSKVFIRLQTCIFKRSSWVSLCLSYFGCAST